MKDWKITINFSMWSPEDLQTLEDLLWKTGNDKDAEIVNDLIVENQQYKEEE